MSESDRHRPEMDAQRLRAYLRIDKETLPRPASLALQRGPRPAGADKRLREYTRIDSGHEA